MGAVVKSKGNFFVPALDRIPHSFCGISVNESDQTDDCQKDQDDDTGENSFFQVHMTCSLSEALYNICGNKRH